MTFEVNVVGSTEVTIEEHRAALTFRELFDALTFIDQRIGRWSIPCRPQPDWVKELIPLLQRPEKLFAVATHDCANRFGTTTLLGFAPSEALLNLVAAIRAAESRVRRGEFESWRASFFSAAPDGDPQTDRAASAEHPLSPDASSSSDADSPSRL